ncbi:MAG: hypothetical protein A2235_05715 [Deltaproteobacteria bacterium RIFOXYA2_FULL_42_10]|nr:MAG: hypothetical protein A2235_05715 [Deltaproteobacteria bacterium RIFOXYA2_FULL_42_10]
MQYFEIILENGHMGAGNGYEVRRYFRGKNILSIISKIKYIPRVKKKHTTTAVKFVRAINREDYIKGKVMEYDDLYLSRGFCGVYQCPICGKKFQDVFSFRNHIKDMYGVHLSLASYS